MPDDNLKDLENEDFVWNLLSPWINKNNAKLERSVIYNFHACIANKWQKGNVFIAGDSAHQMPPFMGAGMGTGIRDVANLSWKINLVLKNIAKSEILKTYQKERYPHAKWTIAQTVSIGEIIEGFCAAEEGKKFIPEKKGYDVKFPHIPSGIFTNPEDRISGYPVPQPTLHINNKKIKLDKIIKSKFVIISNLKKFEVTNKAKQIIKHLNMDHIFINKNDDPENRLANIFKLYDFIIVRPDLYVYGGSKKDNLSEMIESLEKNFSLFT